MSEVEKLSLEDVVKLAEKMLNIKKFVQGGIEYYQELRDHEIERLPNNMEKDDAERIANGILHSVVYEIRCEAFSEIMEFINDECEEK